MNCLKCKEYIGEISFTNEAKFCESCFDSLEIEKQDHPRLEDLLSEAEYKGLI